MNNEQLKQLTEECLIEVRMVKEQLELVLRGLNKFLKEKEETKQ